MNRLALFDCDGTLVDSAANICRAMETVFIAYGLVVPDHAAIRRIVGLSLVESMATLHPSGDDSLHRRMADDYKSAFSAMRGTPDFMHEPLYDGVADAIATLAADGWLLGIATGKSDRGLGMILTQHGLRNCFVTLQTADRHPSKPHPSMALAAMTEAGALPETTVMIGDTVFDMGLAHAAGAHAIGVEWGYHTPLELRRAGASRTVSHARDIAGAAVACLHDPPISTS